MKIEKGTPTGIVDSNGTEICFGDTIKFEYMRGFNVADDGTKIHCFPYSNMQEASHEQVVEWEVRKDCAGFFLDIPRGMTMTGLMDTIKYFVKK